VTFHKNEHFILKTQYINFKTFTNFLVPTCVPRSFFRSNISNLSGLRFISLQSKIHLKLKCSYAVRDVSNISERSYSPQSGYNEDL
jgi:hypothetical protein